MRRLSLSVKVAGNFFRSLSNEIEAKDPPRGRERKKNDFNFFSTATAELHTGGSSNGTRHGERSFEESVSRLNRYRTFSREI